MLTLLYKDFKLMFGHGKSTTSKIIAGIFKIIFFIFFIGVEVFLFCTILKKIKDFQDAPLAYMNLFLFIISIILIISGIVRANKLFFNEKDIEQLSVHPIPNSSIILSKLVFLFFSHYATSFAFIYPLFIAYARIIGKGIWFYYLGLFYPVFTFLFEIGIALLFVYPYWLGKKFLSRHLIVKFILILIVLFIGCIVYAKILNLFMNMIAGGNINALFTTTTIEKVKNIQRYEIPIKFLISFVVDLRISQLLLYLSIAIGTFVIGTSIAIFAFNYVRNISVYAKPKTKVKEAKLTTVTKALVKKEIMILVKNDNYSLSFTGLLIVQPFLVYLVIKALNQIFTNGTFAYYTAMVPNFISLLDIVILMLFTVIIAQGANQYISMEHATIKVMKTIPVKYSKQIFIKIIIPFIMSSASLLITFLVLLIGGVINFKVFFFGIFLVELLLVVFDIVSLKEELCVRHKKPRSTYLSNLYSYLVPLIFFLVTCVFSYFKVSIYVACLLGGLVIILFGLPIALYLMKKANSLFMELDMVN